MYEHAKIESSVREIWKKENVAEKIVKLDGKRKKFYLLDGPPYVNGIPHVGHAKTTIFKDIWGKLKYMQGYGVWFQPGFDCGGLPIENKVEKKLGIKSKTEIEEKIGVDNFIEECHKFAKGNEPVWLNFYKKIGAWRGWLDPYLTSENYYLESGWWTVKKWFEQGLFIEGFRPGFWCPHCETVLAGIESSESYKNVEDPSIIIKFSVRGSEERLLVFTTTPWTLPANAAIAVHPDEIYVKAVVDGETLILAEKRLEILEGKKYKIAKKFPGKNLAGIKYEPLLNTPSQKEIAKNKNALHVIVSVPVMKKRLASKTHVKQDTSQSDDEFGHIVTMDVGTGLVHIAPGHGDSDNRIGKHYGLPESSPVDEKGRLTAEAGKYAGIFVKKADPLIIEELKKDGKIFSAGTIMHAYPLCWRCKTPLIYRMSRQWFLKMDMLRDKILKANKKINWLPEFARERYHNTISEAPDWAVTRQRYWGIPLPVWSCECGTKKVIGSVEELKKAATKKLPEKFDLHKNFVDSVKIKCACGREMVRENDIMDVWFDSGIAPWASLGYPFMNKELFKKLWNVDLIDESQDQIRAWFNTLMICGFATFGEAPYKTVCLNGWTLDEKGQKMSKSLGNIIEAEEAYKELGADALRLYCCHDNAPWATQKFSMRNANEMKGSLTILWNTYIYFKTYCKIEAKPKALQNEDRWILSRLNSLIKNALRNMEEFAFHEASRAIMSFIVEDFSRMYIKIVRDRSGSAVNYTLTAVLENLSKLLAPIAPFISEYVYHEMFGSSVHLCNYPKHDEKFINMELEEQMSAVKKVVEACSVVRQEKNVRLRWPLNKIFIECKGADDLIENFGAVLKILCNVKNVEKGFDKNLASKELESFKISVDTNLSEELKSESLFRELTRKIQEQRKKEGLTVGGKIILELDNKIVRKFADEIKEKVDAEKIVFKKLEKPLGEVALFDEVVKFSFSKKSSS